MHLVEQSANERTQGLTLREVQEPLAVVILVRDEQGNLRQSVHLGPGTLSVGASPDADVVIDDPAVSRTHVHVSLASRGVTVRDAKSRNGTFYLGQNVGEITLDLGSRITIGKTSLEFVADQKDFEGTQGRVSDHYGALLGQSPPMRRLFTLMKRLEGSTVNVLIEGESGTGKELIARALHDHSKVKEGPFVAVNCGALDRDLARSELFGHKKGAFTGALSEAQGAFADADGGTLFLDEIGELPLEVQPILLRTLETGSVTRIGESKARPLNVRLIAATHRTLKEDAEAGLFRQDLYFRLMVVRLVAPALRERPGDLLKLIDRLCEEAGLQPLSAEVKTALSQRRFPGNVRELKHAILAYGAIGEIPDDTSDPAMDLDQALAPFVNTNLAYADQKEALVDRMTHLYLSRLIEDVGGNRSEAARRAGLQRGYLRRLLEKYGLD